MNARSRRPWRAPALVSGAAIALGCSASPGGPEYTELGLRAEDAAATVLGSACTPLPVLPGGTVEEDPTLAPGLSAHVVAVEDSVEVTLSGTTEPSAGHLTVSQQALYHGYSRALAVTTLDGRSLTVYLVSPCPSPDGSASGS